jgi:hypothetical protein
LRLALATRRQHCALCGLIRGGCTWGVESLPRMPTSNPPRFLSLHILRREHHTVELKRTNSIVVRSAIEAPLHSPSPIALAPRPPVAHQPTPAQQQPTTQRRAREPLPSRAATAGTRDVPAGQPAAPGQPTPSSTDARTPLGTPARPPRRHQTCLRRINPPRPVGHRRRRRRRVQVSRGRGSTASSNSSTMRA